jgi:para-nitrobenzyl esterase
MKHVSTLLFALLLMQISSKAQVKTGENFAVTETQSGKVRGYAHNAVYTFKGIPYAEANRFESAHAPKSWTGVRSSMTYGPVAPLLSPTTSVQDESEFVFDHNWGYTSEDCMRINVWTPGLKDGKKRPVLFWIHGGGFTAGSSQELPSYDGENLAKRGDVVVVSINHRLNILGYLDMSKYGEKYAHSANNSILDIVTALEWVKSNIGNFGGDANNVTIFGQSGGGAKVNVLMSMPKATGLFHKAINQSGAFRTNLMKKETAQEITAEVLNVLHLNADQADSLQKVPFQTLSEAGAKALKIVSDRMRNQGGSAGFMGLSWGPELDGTDLPNEIFSKESLELSKHVPLLIGTVKNEFMASLFTNMTNASMDQVMNAIKAQRKDKAEAFVKAVKKAYPNDTKPSDLMDVDAMFRPGAINQANIKSALNAAPVYMYLFTWQSPVLDGKYKAMHCMELPFVFNNIAACEQMTGGGKEAYALAAKMSDAWINFAKTGNPNNIGLPKWPAYTTNNTATMHFNNDCKVLPQMDKELFELLAQ